MFRIVLSCLFYTGLQAQDSTTKEFVPLLPAQSQLTFSQWKTSPQHYWIKGTTRGRLQNGTGCSELTNEVTIFYDFYNTATDQGKSTLLAEKSYIADMYDKIKSGLLENMEAEKQKPEYTNAGKLLEEALGDGKAFWHQRTALCKDKATKSVYVSYVAYVPVRSGFIQIDINCCCDAEKAKAVAKEIYTNIKGFDAYNFFAGALKSIT